MNIDYTENTKSVEDTMHRHITDSEDCGTVMECLQKMQVINT